MGKVRTWVPQAIGAIWLLQFPVNALFRLVGLLGDADTLCNAAHQDPVRCGSAIMADFLISPPAWFLTLSVFVGVSFILWGERRRYRDEVDGLKSSLEEVRMTVGKLTERLAPVSEFVAGHGQRADAIDRRITLLREVANYPHQYAFAVTKKSRLDAVIEELNALKQRESDEWTSFADDLLSSDYDQDRQNLRRNFPQDSQWHSATSDIAMFISSSIDKYIKMESKEYDENPARIAPNEERAKSNFYKQEYRKYFYIRKSVLSQVEEIVGSIANEIRDLKIYTETYYSRITDEVQMLQSQLDTELKTPL